MGRKLDPSGQDSKRQPISAMGPTIHDLCCYKCPIHFSQGKLPYRFHPPHLPVSRYLSWEYLYQAKQNDILPNNSIIATKACQKKILVFLQITSLGVGQLAHHLIQYNSCTCRQIHPLSFAFNYICLRQVYNVKSELPSQNSTCTKTK